MITRTGLEKKGLGDYSEMITAAAFIAEGAEVALPFGNQRKWDLIIRRSRSEGWRSVQVKTVPTIGTGRNPSVSTTMQDKGKSAYTSDDVDLLVAVHPETGTLWLIPAEIFSGHKRTRLVDEYLWRGVVERASTPLSDEVCPLMVPRNKRLARAAQNMKTCFANQAEERKFVRDSLPKERPDWASEARWSRVIRWCNGEGYGTIARDCGIGATAVRECIMRVITRIAKGEGDRTTHRRGVPNKDQLAMELLLARANRISDIGKYGHNPSASEDVLDSPTLF